jgi:ATP-dependent Clp protease ATP-binding subunit ClpC
MTMTSMFGASPFDDLIDRFLRGDPFAGTTPRRPVERVDLFRLMSEQARELVRHAAEQAALWGSPDVDTTHLLWAATQLPSTRRLLEHINVDPDRLGRLMEEAVEKGEPADHAPPLTPAAKRALIDAHSQAQRAGVSYIGPEHILLGVANNPDTVPPAANCTRRRIAARRSPRAVWPAPAPARPPARRPPWTSTGATSPPKPVKAGWTPS